MNLSFENDALARQCARYDAVLRTWGPELGPIVRRRIVQLAAAETVAVLRSLPFGHLISTPDGTYIWRSKPAIDITFSVIAGNPAPPTEETDMTVISIRAIKAIYD